MKDVAYLFTSGVQVGRLSSVATRAVVYFDAF